MEICNLLGATCRVRRPRRTAAATAARNPRKNLFLPSLCTIIKWYILPAFRHFLFIWKRKRLQKKSKLRAAPRDLANAAPQHLACGSQLVARHIRAQTRRSLNECALVRLASQAVPSPVSIGYQTLRCGYGKHDYRSQLITFFYIATVRVIDKSQFIKPKYSTLLYTCSNINKADLRTPH